jgi:hypothetical protein
MTPLPRQGGGKGKEIVMNIYSTGYAEGLSVLLFGSARLHNTAHETMVELLLRNKETPNDYGYAVDAYNLRKDGEKALRALSNEQKQNP